MRKIQYSRTVTTALVSVLLFAASSWSTALGGGNHIYSVESAVTDTAKTDTSDVDVLVSEDDRPWPQNVQARLEELLKNDMFETSTVGMMVYDLTADSVIFKHNERQLMRPASTLKMMVAVTALDRLGSDYEYETMIPTSMCLSTVFVGLVLIPYVEIFMPTFR